MTARTPDPSASIPPAALAPPDDGPTGVTPPLAWLRETPYWLVAVLLHLVLLLVLGTIVVLEAPEAEVEVMTLVRALEEEPVYERPEPRDVEFRPDLPDPRKPPIEAPTIVEPLRPSTSPQQADVAAPLPAIGLAPDLRGGSPDVGKRWEIVGTLPAGSRSSILDALEWLARHQHPDGRWSAAGFHAACDAARGGPCAFRDASSAPAATDAGFAEYDVGVTGLALLAFTGAGYTHRDGERADFRDAVRRASAWLLARQLRSDDERLDGLVGAPLEGTKEWIYNHAIATLALTDLYLLSRDRIRLVEPVRAAVGWCLRAQNPGWGWKYGHRPGPNDTSVTGWMVLVLRSARACELCGIVRFPPGALDESLSGALRWIDAATAESTGRTGYESPGDAGSRLLGAHEEYRFSKELSCMTAVGALCRLIAGEGRRSPMLRLALAHLAENPPEWRLASGKRLSKVNFYSWYYGSAALQLAGGSGWTKWEDALRAELIPNQRADGCADGSWDPLDEWGVAGGRVTSTALAALTLEAAARFARETE